MRAIIAILALAFAISADAASLGGHGTNTFQGGCSSKLNFQVKCNSQYLNTIIGAP